MRDASFSREVLVRIPLSDSTTSSKSGGTQVDTISAVSRPSSVPSAASRWERSAQRSCSSRLMPFSLAIRSALSPMVSPVEYSAMAGVVGTSSPGLNPANAFRRSFVVRALDASMSRSLISRETRMGMSDRDSAPPATTMSP